MDFLDLICWSRSFILLNRVKIRLESVQSFLNFFRFKKLALIVGLYRKFWSRVLFMSILLIEASIFLEAMSTILTIAIFEP